MPGAPPNRAEALVGAGFPFVCELFLHAEALVYLPAPPLAGEDGSKPVARASAKPSTPHRGASAPPAISRMPSPRGYCAALERFAASLKKGEGESLAGYSIPAMPGDLPRMLVRLPVAIPAKGPGAWIGGNLHWAVSREACGVMASRRNGVACGEGLPILWSSINPSGGRNCAMASWCHGGAALWCDGQ